MSAPRRLVVVGLGLLGGSLALAARERGAAREVVGVSRREDVLAAGRARGAVDRVAELPDAVRGADLVVLATPVPAMAEAVRSMAPELEHGCVVTDVGSVKAGLAETLPGLLPRGVAYVGAHPMAGSHERGFEHARADLFEGAACVVMDDGEEWARQRVEAFFAALGARVVQRAPAVHDTEVAWTSHLPHLLAFAFGAAYAQAPGSAAEVSGGGFRDFTRIARSDAELWADILAGNRKALAAPVEAVRRALTELVQALEADDVEALERAIAIGRAALEQRGGRRAASSELPQPPTAEGPGGARKSNPNT